MFVFEESQLKEVIQRFQQIVGEEQVLTQPDEVYAYGADHTEQLHFAPVLVVFPNTTDEVSRLMKVCYEQRIPVTPRGAGTGLAGGALPIMGGVVMSFKRMNRILHIDEQNLQVTTQPGVITQVLQEALEEKNLFYPPDPSSRGTCYIGGNVSTNSGGPKAVKYGVVKDYVLNLEVVLPNGDVIWTGANVLKNSTGYALTQLMIGSEGTLGIITQIVLKVIPLPTHNLLMLAPFNSLENAGAAVSAIFRSGITPSVLELVEINALKIVQQYLNSSSIPLREDTEAHLLIEVDGNNPDQLMHEMESIAALLEQFNCGELYFAEDEQQKEALWKMRRRVAEAVKANGYTIEEDTVVPRAQLPALIRSMKAMAQDEQVEVVCYGHAGDGNLHIRLKIPGEINSYNNPKVTAILMKLFERVHELGGTISGEHGIGLIQKPFLPIVMPDATRILLKEIKRVFDPRNILNPGKIMDA
ncbi:MAG TPA: FAD-linked oxidase C-terminal domain-containing protein [Ferruginibacter sp.]|nr:FAD-linked oxidase C-terminal domain-containing protein [Ferruginibacter sp.]